MAVDTAVMEGALSDLLVETRKFEPCPEFKQRASLRDPLIREKAAENPEAFWGAFAEELVWSRKWDKVLDWSPPYARWFVGGKLNASYNCLDRHVAKGLRNKAAIIWEGEQGERRNQR